MIQILWGFLGAVFGAGVGYGVRKQQLDKMRGDLNGLGRKYGRLAALMIRWADTEEKRNQLADAIEPPK